MLPGRSADTPLVTLVVPTYDVARYLPEFLGSLDAQDLGADELAEIQLVVVDDGSHDGSGEVVRAWATTARYAVEVVRQDNRGLSGARNAGLERARGTWVGFPDPDDVLGPGYLRLVLDRLRTATDDVALLATRILVLDGNGATSDTHRLRGRFAGGSRVVDLEVEPDAIHLQAASACFRRDLLERAGLRFDPEVRPNFEDAFLTAHYLAAAPAPRVALLAEAHYVYRRRADGSSLMQESWRRPEKYTVLPQRGYLRLLQDFAARGPVPTWVQNLVLYDLLFYFREDQREPAATAGLDPALSAAFHEAVAAILALVDPDVLAGFSVIPTSWVLREALRIGYVDRDAVPDRVHLWRVDAEQQIVQLRYLHGTRAPREELVVGGRVVEPVHAKVRDLRWFGETLAHERIAWVPATAPVQVRLDGRRVPLVLGEPDERLRVEPGGLWRSLARRAAPTAAPRRPSPAAPRPHPAPAPAAVLPDVPAARPPAADKGRARGLAAVARRVVRHPAEPVAAPPPPPPRPAAERFAGAWAFTDDDDAAGGEAELLCRWVREHHPEVDAWFVVSRSSADWARLEAEGFDLVDPASPDAARLWRGTAHRVASRVDDDVVAPLADGRARGRFTYLPRRTLLDDTSRTLDRKRVSLLATALTDEQAYVAGDGSPYLFTTKEVALTGLPRHDRLGALAASGERPTRLVVAPATTAGVSRWSGLLADPAVRGWAAGHGLEPVLLLPDLDVDHSADGVTVLRRRQADLLALLATTAVLVTDDDALALDLAYLERPVVHLDHDEPPGRRPGWWSAESHGVGPVCRSAAEVAAALADVRTDDGRLVPCEPWAGRMTAAYPSRDGRACERVAARVLALTEPAAQATALAETWVPTRLGPVPDAEPDAETDEGEG